MTRSAIYDGVVVQHRARSRLRGLGRVAPFVLLDLDALAETGTTLFSVNRANLFSFREADHGSGDARGLRCWVATMLSEAGIGGHVARVAVLAMPTVLGRATNPVTLYFCERADGSPLALVCELVNAPGDRHACAFAIDRAARPGDVVRAHVRTFAVSPFVSPRLDYRVAVRFSADGIELSFVATEDDETVLSARFTGRRRRLADRVLAWLLLRHIVDALGIAAPGWRHARRARRRPPADRRGIATAAHAR